MGELQVFRERWGIEKGGSKDGNPFPAKKLKPVNGGGGEGWASMVMHLQFYCRWGGYLLYNLWIYFIEIWLSVFWNLLLSLLINGVTWEGEDWLPQNIITLTKLDNRHQQSCRSVMQKLILEVLFLRFFFASLLMVICVQLYQTNG